MVEERAEGIVLRSLEYKDRQRIITLFTREAGMISLIVKQLSGRRSHLMALTTPFSRGDYIYRRGRSELMPLQDATLIDEHLGLRTGLKFLETGGVLIQAILSSQMPGKPAPDLYALFAAYLKHLPHVPDADTLICSFLLKLLKHEGLIGWDVFSLFKAEEWDSVKQLLNISSFNKLGDLKIPSDFNIKIRRYFKEKIEGH